MLKKLSIRDIDFLGKRVFCRVDFNVPLDENNQITDDTRVKASMPTIRHIINNGGRLILASHLGRPKNGPEAKFSLASVAPCLSQYLGKPVKMAPDCIGPDVARMVNQMENGDVLLLENVRIHAGETKNDPEFAKALSENADIYVNNAFGTAHRAHASTEGVTHYLQPAAAGFLLEKEIKYLGQALAYPDHPFVAVIGGAKVSDKIAVIENLLDKVDTLIIGGGMAYTFLRATGRPTGQSLVEEDRIELAKKLLQKAADNGVSLLLPQDHVVASEFSPNAEHKTCSDADFPAGWMALDIGPATIATYTEALRNARMVIWNGPMGVFEMEPFDRGTKAVAVAVATATDNGARSIIGGGDSASAVQKLGLEEKISHISTGGGASLEFLEGKKFTCLEILDEK